jgi:hypothetical protein
MHTILPLRIQNVVQISSFIVMFHPTKMTGILKTANITQAFRPNASDKCQGDVTGIRTKWRGTSNLCILPVWMTA